MISTTESLVLKTSRTSKSNCRRRRRIYVPDTHHVRSTCRTPKTKGHTVLRFAIGYFQYYFYTFRENHLFRRKSRNPSDESLNTGNNIPCAETFVEDGTVVRRNRQRSFALDNPPVCVNTIRTVTVKTD